MFGEPGIHMLKSSLGNSATHGKSTLMAQQVGTSRQSISEHGFAVTWGQLTIDPALQPEGS